MSEKFAGLGLQVEAPARMTIVHPVSGEPLKDGAGEAAFIDVFSSDSEAARKHDRARRNKLIKSLAGGKRARKDLTAEQGEQENLDLLVALTAGWHLVGLDGKPIKIPFSPEAARELYASPATAWLREQVDAFAGDRANFSQASSTS